MAMVPGGASRDWGGRPVPFQPRIIPTRTDPPPHHHTHTNTPRAHPPPPPLQLTTRQIGFVAAETGQGRSKNVRNILLKNIINITLCALCWWAVGYAFAYGASTSGVIG